MPQIQKQEVLDDLVRTGSLRSFKYEKNPVSSCPDGVEYVDVLTLTFPNGDTLAIESRATSGASSNLFVGK
jgi:hypothetical protein